MDESTAGSVAPAKAPRGFALMDRSRLKAVSSKGGSALHTSKRGFATMDENRLREVSRKGIAARRGAGTDKSGKTGSDI